MPTFRELFAGYYPLAEDDLREVYRSGMISLDANVLLDLYRFTPRARDELIEILERVKDRIFVTHQAAAEFHQNRLNVVDKRLAASTEMRESLSKIIDSLNQLVNEYSNRYQISKDVKDSLAEDLQHTANRLLDKLESATAYDLDREVVKSAKDVVLERLEGILAGRVGAPLEEAEYRAALKEAERRKKEQIPPGYMDKKSDDRKSWGDYLVWVQLISEAKLRKLPVMFVSSEKKEDWVLKSGRGENLGARPELVQEMKELAGCQFAKISVAGLLRDAPIFLGVEVSESTIREAESLPSNSTIKVKFSSLAAAQFAELGVGRRDQMLHAVWKVRSMLDANVPVDAISSLEEKDGGRYLVRWSDRGRALITFEPIRQKGSSRSWQVTVIDITNKKLGSRESM